MIVAWAVTWLLLIACGYVIVDAWVEWALRRPIDCLNDFLRTLGVRVQIWADDKMDEIHGKLRGEEEERE